MEVTGLVIGIASLAALFNSCMDSFDYVTLAREHAKDFEIALTKLLLLKARLGAWGTAVRATSPGDELPALKEQWQDSMEIVGRSLQGIQQLLQDSKKLQQKYGLVTAEAGLEGAQMTELREIDEAFQTTIVQRQRATSWSKKAVWALHDRDKFNALLTDLEFFIDNLEALLQHLGTVATVRRSEILQDGIMAVKKQTSVKLLLAASEDDSASPASDATDPLKFPSMGPYAGEEPPRYQAASLSSHQFIKNVIQEQAQAILGDIGDVGPNASKSEYKENEISGSAQAVLGNVDGAFATNFFRRK